MSVKVRKAKIKPVSVKATLSQVFFAAAEAVKLRGWAQGQAESSDGRICASQAVRLVTGGDRYPTPRRQILRRRAQVALENAIYKRTHKSGSIPAYNDRKGRTAEQVIGLLTATAKQEAKWEAASS